MYKILLTNKAIHSIKNYTKQYRDFFEETYQDSGVWAEDKIIDGYIIESENRYQEIRNLLKEKLSNSIILYSKNEIIIRWRSKILLVSFKEEGDTRIITDIEIR